MTPGWWGEYQQEWEEAGVGGLLSWHAYDAICYLLPVENQVTDLGLNLSLTTVGPLHTNEFHSESTFISQICSLSQTQFDREGFPGGSAVKSLHAGDTGLIPGIWRFLWSRKWQPTSVFLPGKFQGQRTLAGCNTWSHKELDTTEHTHTCPTNTIGCIGLYCNRFIILFMHSNQVGFIPGMQGFFNIHYQSIWYTTFSSVQSLSCVQLSATPWTTARQASLSITTSRSLLKPPSIELVIPSNYLIFCRPLPLYHINKIKSKNHVIISTDAEKAFDKIQHPFMNNNNNKLSRNWA